MKLTLTNFIMNEQNLVLKGYGVTLKKLTHDKIELVRNWRNDPKIQQTMFFQDYITSEMQEKWFSRINNENNYYFIVEYNDEEIGLINIKDIDYLEKTGETGVFIYEDKYLGTDISYRAHLVMFDYIFDYLRLEKTYAHIRKDNNIAIRFSIFLGALKSEHNSNATDCEIYIITKDSYFSNKNRKRFLLKYNKLNK